MPMDARRVLQNNALEMTVTISFRHRPEAAAFAGRLKALCPGIYTKIYILRGRYACSASGDRLTAEMVEQAKKGGAS